MKTLKKGDRVKIYQKPLTEEDYEGEAELVKHLSDGSYGDAHIEDWLVRFEDGIKIRRTIRL